MRLWYLWMHFLGKVASGTPEAMHPLCLPLAPPRPDVCSGVRLPPAALLHSQGI